MKNSAVRAMISNQFNRVEISQINVVFLSSIAGVETYDVKLVDEDGKYREFVLTLDFVEVTQ
ncbi:hypothetical protein vBPpSSYP_114 [Pseudomonas phage vB_PpS_SYP]|nr:hypothetical protein vBPpSSYP_114 [Pseudomonas phage vB_PpS_SYP]